MQSDVVDHRENMEIARIARDASMTKQIPMSKEQEEYWKQKDEEMDRAYKQKEQFTVGDLICIETLINVQIQKVAKLEVLGDSAHIWTKERELWEELLEKVRRM